LLEEAVSSELVSEMHFPDCTEDTGNFIDSRLGSPSTAAKKGVELEPYGRIPCASEQGIFAPLLGI
jgi:hypothetical protein